MMMPLPEFLASLPAPLSCRGDNASSDLEVGARIRSELALAVELGALPAGTKCSVRVGKGGFSGGSIRVEVVAWSGAVFTDAHLEHLLDPSMPGEVNRDRYAPPLAAALEAIETIADRHNFDASRSEEDYFNVGYYLRVHCHTIEAVAKAGLKTESDPAFRALVESARAACKVIGKRASKALTDAAGLEATNEYTLNQIISLADAYGCELAYDRPRGSWVPAGETPAAKLAAKVRAMLPMVRVTMGRAS